MGRYMMGNGKKNKAHGYGKLTLPDGTKYEGGYKNGNFHGQGIMTSPNGNIIYNGQWEDGKKTINNK